MWDSFKNWLWSFFSPDQGKETSSPPAMTDEQRKEWLEIITDPPGGGD